MEPLLLAGISAFVVCLALTPVVRETFQRFGIVDCPDRTRKFHTRSVPRVGGIAVAVSYVAALGIVIWWSHQAQNAAPDAGLKLVWKLMPAAAIVFGTGLLDDLIRLRPSQKLLGMAFAAAVAWSAGVRIGNIAGHLVGPPWDFLATAAWIIGCTNAFNLIDGVDGLAAGVGLFAALTTAAVALLHGNIALALASVPLAGCLLGFLVYNFNPASIFLGDCGSLLIGFLLACYSIIWSQKCATLLEIAAPLMAVAVPLTDTALSMARRFIRLQPIFRADHDHIHHRLLKIAAGNSKSVAITVYAICGLAAGASLLQSQIGGALSAMVLAGFCLIVWFGIRQLHYIEFHAACRLLLGGGIRRMLRAEVSLGTLEETLAGSKTADEAWRCIVLASRLFGFSRASLVLGENVLEQRFNRAPQENCWSMRIPLTGCDYIEFSQEFHPPDGVLPTAFFVDIVRRAFTARMRESSPENHLRESSRLKVLKQGV